MECLIDKVAGIPLLSFDTNDPRHYWQMAYHFNKHPEELEEFFDQAGCLQAFARIVDRLNDDTAAEAVKIASRLIIAVAKKIADSGYRASKLKLFKGFKEGADIELDQSLERYTDEPERGILDCIVSYVRDQEKKGFVMMIDCSYSMKSQIILAAITAAAIAQHYKKDYAILAFSNTVGVLRETHESAGPETVLKRLFALRSYGDTNMRLALEAGLLHVRSFKHKTGLLLTDGDWNKGGDPYRAALRFDKLNIIGFPFSNHDKIRELACQGRGTFSIVRDETEIAGAILRCLN